MNTFKPGDPVWVKNLSDGAVAVGIPRGSESPGEVVTLRDSEGLYVVDCPNDPPAAGSTDTLWSVPEAQLRPRFEDGPLEMVKAYDGNQKAQKSDVPYWGSIRRPVTA